MSDALPVVRRTTISDIETANALAKSKLIPLEYQHSPSSILWVKSLGEALGMNVASAMQSIHIIQGKPALSAQLMAALVLKQGHRMRIRGNDQAVEVIIIRKDDPEFEHRSVWDLARAKKAELLGKENWRKYTYAMLRSRAVAECVRSACPDVLMGWYTPEELGAAVDADGNPMGVHGPSMSPEQKLAEKTLMCTTSKQALKLLEKAKADRLLSSLVITPEGPMTLDAHIRTIGRELLQQEQQSNEESSSEDGAQESEDNG